MPCMEQKGKELRRERSYRGKWVYFFSLTNHSIKYQDVPSFVEVRIHGKINGHVIPPKAIRFAKLQADIDSNDLVAKLLDLPSPLGKDATQMENRLVGLMATPGLQVYS